MIWKGACDIEACHGVALISIEGVIYHRNTLMLDCEDMSLLHTIFSNRV